MRSVDSSFYHTAAWKHCRKTYLASHPLCEACLDKGIVTPARHVHHIVWLNSDNVSDPSVSLNHANLKALCHTCHNTEHFGTHQPKRYEVLPNGNVVATDTAPYNEAF